LRADVVVVGAGPCGLGCIRELAFRGCDDVVVLEAADHPGGLAASTTDAQGFTWDRGGHVVFSHHGEFDRLLDDVLGGEVLLHERSSWVLAAGSWVPYPFQNNLHRLPAEVMHECLVGLVTVGARPRGDGDGRSTNGHGDFASWIRGTFGPGIERHFMAPYNEKVWATPLDTMSASWIAGRVSVTDWRAAVATVLRRTDDVAWGPNNRFAFPVRGGTGEIWRRAAEPFAASIRYGTTVREVDAAARIVRTADDREWSYGTLVSTMPLDLLVGALVDCPAEVREAAATLVHNTVHVVGVGYEAPVGDDRSWLYFADPDVPFYRATNFAKYAPANVPGGDTARFSSWMCEVSSSSTRPVVVEGLAERVEAALRATGVVTGRPRVASLHVEKVPYAYPVPTRGRDAALAVVVPWLDAQGIFSRGRFGTWRYEVGNMDHAVKMGVDVARRIATGAREELVA
jgi:protoporphyrinogen oxidase